MQGKADETEQLPKERCSGLGPPSAALSLNGIPKFLAGFVPGGNHGWRIRLPAPEMQGRAETAFFRACVPKWAASSKEGRKWIGI